MPDFPEYKFLTTEVLDDGLIVRIMLNRPETRNAQNRGLLVELDDAFKTAEADDVVRVIILGGHGPVFSSGHDVGSAVSRAERELGGPDQHPSYRSHGGSLNDGKTGEARYLQEWHFFLDNTLRWRNLRKITVCQVQGPAFIAAAMVAWACDFIVAAQDAEFGDPAATRFGNDHGEYFAHPWEMGVRKAKEFLILGDTIGAEEAYRLGFVARVFPTDQLNDLTLEFARKIAKIPSMALLMIKEACNETQDIQGFTNALKASFALHHVMQQHWAEMRDDGVPTAPPGFGVPERKDWTPLRRMSMREP